MRKLLTAREEILSCIFAKEVVLGDEVVFGENVQIGAPDSPLRRVEIGDNVYLGQGSTVLSRNLPCSIIPSCTMDFWSTAREFAGSGITPGLA